MSRFESLLHEADPARDVADHDDARIVREVQRAVTSAPVAVVVPLRTPYLRRTGVRVAIAATAAVAVLLLPVVSMRGGAASPAAAAVLSRAASFGATDPIARADQWWVVTSHGSRLTMSQSAEGGSESASAYLVPVTRTEWVAVDGGVRQPVGPSTVYSLYVLPDGDLLLSGDFSIGGETVSPYFIRCTIADCPPCPADFNRDGGVDGADVESFYVAWEAGDSVADVNRDGGVDGGDVEFFVVTWEAGGC